MALANWEHCQTCGTREGHGRTQEGATWACPDIEHEYAPAHTDVLDELSRQIAVAQAMRLTARTESMRDYWDGRQRGVEDATRIAFGMVLSLAEVNARAQAYIASWQESAT